MSNKLWIVDLESIPNRYTSEWKTEVPRIMEERLPEDWGIEIVEGPDTSGEVTEGAFLQFEETNRYKSHQVIELSNLISKKVIEDGDVILFTDAWHPGVINLKYMLELNDLNNVKLLGMWHAGSYDSADILSRKLSDWATGFEATLFEVYDVNLFATEFHKDMFLSMAPPLWVDDEKIKVVGWPMDYSSDLIERRHWEDKENVIVFPHRICPEKCGPKYSEFVEKLRSKFRDDNSPLYGWKYIESMNYPYSGGQTKEMYHELLSKSKISISLARQETLGISMYESLLAGCELVVPDYLSYTEMYPPRFKYDSDYIYEVDKLIEFIEEKVRYATSRSGERKFQMEKGIDIYKIGNRFFSGESITNLIKSFSETKEYNMKTVASTKWRGEEIVSVNIVLKDVSSDSIPIDSLREINFIYENNKEI